MAAQYEVPVDELDHQADHVGVDERDECDQDPVVKRATYAREEAVRDEHDPTVAEQDHLKFVACT